MPRWRVDYLGKKASHLGMVEAPDEQSAITKAAEQFEISPARRFKIVVQKISRDKEDLKQKPQPRGRG